MTPHVLIIGGSVAGATAASTLCSAGIKTTIIERELVRPKPCGGAVPPAVFHEFAIPRHIIDRAVHRCVVLSPSGRDVAFPIVGSSPSDDDYVAMVRREVFDGFLRERAQQQGATLIHAHLRRLYIHQHSVEAVYQEVATGKERMIRADAVIGADGANSPTARFLGLQPAPDSVAVQERIRLNPDIMHQWHDTAAMYLGQDVSPDFYGWLFPKADHVTIGVGIARKHVRQARHYLAALKQRLGTTLANSTVIAYEAHVLPMTPYKQMAFDRAMLVGDAARLVVRTSGEGIYWAMKSAHMAASVLAHHIDAPTAHNLRAYERQWWRTYGSMYRFLWVLEKWGYGNNRQMEVFTDMCRNTDVQRLTFDSYMHKHMVPGSWRSQLTMTRDIIKSQLYHYIPH